MPPLSEAVTAMARGLPHSRVTGNPEVIGSSVGLVPLNALVIIDRSRLVAARKLGTPARNAALCPTNGSSQLLLVYLVFKTADSTFVSIPK